MLTIEIVNPAEYIPQIMDLLRDNWAETGFGGEFDPDVRGYQQLYDLGMMFALKANDGDQVVGYCTVTVTPHLHNPRTITAANDALYVAPDYRKGTLTARLMRAAEDEARRRGSSEMLWHCRAGTPFAAMLERHGYEPVDQVVRKGF